MEISMNSAGFICDTPVMNLEDARPILIQILFIVVPCEAALLCDATLLYYVSFMAFILSTQAS